jgi:hypothetical protein
MGAPSQTTLENAPTQAHWIWLSPTPKRVCV